MDYYLRFHPAGDGLASHGIGWSEGDWHQVSEFVWVLRDVTPDPLTFDAATSAPDSSAHPDPRPGWVETLTHRGLHPVITPEGVKVGDDLYVLQGWAGDITGTSSGGVNYRYRPHLVV